MPFESGVRSSIANKSPHNYIPFPQTVFTAIAERQERGDPIIRDVFFNSNGYLKDDREYWQNLLDLSRPYRFLVLDGPIFQLLEGEHHPHFYAIPFRSILPGEDYSEPHVVKPSSFSHLAKTALGERQPPVLESLSAKYDLDWLRSLPREKLIAIR